MEDPNSLVIEVFGLKATALGLWPVAGLLATMMICFVVAAVCGPVKLAAWWKRIGKADK